MNWRAIGCAGLAAVAFIAVGIFAITRAQAPSGCPERLPYEPAAFEPEGPATGEPTLDGVDGPLERGGRASFGLAAWPVWVAAADRPSASDDPLPARIVLECGDGTFQAYRRAAS